MYFSGCAKLCSWELGALCTDKHFKGCYYNSQFYAAQFIVLHCLVFGVFFSLESCSSVSSATVHSWFRLESNSINCYTKTYKDNHCGPMAPKAFIFIVFGTWTVYSGLCSVPSTIEMHYVEVDDISKGNPRQKNVYSKGA